MKIHSEHAENSISFQQLDICCQKIAEQVGSKQISEWTNSDYIKLSGLLARKTKIQLSESTLKRIFGKSKTSIRYYPQKATRNSLAQFIGCRDWQEFELLHPFISERIKPTSSETVQLPVNPSVKNKTSKVFIVIGILLAFTILTTIALQRSNATDPVINNVKLMCLNPEGKTPHSAIFKLAVNGKLPDSSSNFFVDFGENKGRKISFRNKSVNHYYEIPGRYYPVLFFKGTPIDTGYVYLQSKGWVATAFNQNDTTRVYPVSNVKLSLRKDLKISAMEAAHAGVDTNRTFFIAFTNVKPTTVSGDHFELSAHLNASSDRAGVRCSQADIFIYGETAKHVIGIIKPECVAWTYYQFSENFKDGKIEDLRELGHDLTDGADLRLRVENKQVTLLVNSQEAFKTTYNKSIGKIMGIKISFSGVGSIENFQLSDLKTKEEF